MRSGRRATSALAAGRLRRRLRWSVLQPARSLRRCSFWSLSALLLSWPSAGFASDFDLMGSWYVLIHYRDEVANNPEIDRWEDRVWVFGKKGSRLSWTEYPVVMFSDRRGRFERTLSGATRRVLEAWEPNEAQLGEIREGLRVNPRGAKSKGMRGNARRGFRSAGGLRSESASVIGYSESWSIEGLPAKPVFTHDVVMGSGRTENMEGRTRYSGEQVSEDGNEVRGSFVRDGTRRGTFVLRRSGAAVLIGSKQDSAVESDE
jgi:hypothetical protein